MVMHIIYCGIDETIHDERVFCSTQCSRGGWITRVIGSIRRSRLKMDSR
jgi:hypothetical protein